MKLGALADTIGARLLGDASLEIVRVRDVAHAQEGELAFVSAARERRAARTTLASAVLVDDSFAAEHAHELPCAVLHAPRASEALVAAVEVLHPAPAAPVGVDARAAVHTDAQVAASAFVGPFAVVERGARIGAGARVRAFAFVGEGCVVGCDADVGVGAVLLASAVVGDGTVIGPHAVIGDDGFVFSPQGEANQRLRHVGGVRLGNDVAIGALVCVDRGALGDTSVGDGTRIDNLVQVGHDVTIHDHAVIIAQVGLAGHAQVGRGALLAGQSGVQEHTHVGAGARVGARAGVTRDVADGAAVSGMPAIPHAEWLRAMALVPRLRHMERRLAALERAQGGSALPGDKP